MWMRFGRTVYGPQCMFHNLPCYTCSIEYKRKTKSDHSRPRPELVRPDFMQRTAWVCHMRCMLTTRILSHRPTAATVASRREPIIWPLGFSNVLWDEMRVRWRVSLRILLHEKGQNPPEGDWGCAWCPDKFGKQKQIWLDIYVVTAYWHTLSILRQKWQT